MKVSITLRVITATIAITLFSVQALASPAEPEDTVKAFNAAFASKDKDTLIATLAEGGAQFTLRAQHEDSPPDKVQSEISAYWSVIAPVLFASTSAYERNAEILDVRADGDIATVWTNTQTKSTRLGSTEAQTNTFTEVYLLVSSPAGWRIAAIADNRQGTKLDDS